MDAIADVVRSIGGGAGVFDVACPSSGPERRSPANRRRKVLRVWRGDDDFTTWYCARCGESGHSFGERSGSKDGAASKAAQREIARRQAERLQAERLQADERQSRLNKALSLWRSRQPIGGSIAETYLREARGYTGPLPQTLGFLPARGEYLPAMIAAFGIATEPEPGILSICDDAVRGVHLTNSGQTVPARPAIPRRSWSGTASARRSCSRR